MVPPSVLVVVPSFFSRNIHVVVIELEKRLRAMCFLLAYKQFTPSMLPSPSAWKNDAAKHSSRVMCRGKACAPNAQLPEACYP